MGKIVIPIAYQFTAAQIIAGDANNLPKGTSIFIIDANGQTIDAKTAQGGGQAPTEAAGLKNNFAATVAPTVNEDSGDGYSIGSRWIDTVADESYICLDATVGAAVWSKSTVGTIIEVAGLQTALDLKVNKITIQTAATNTLTANHASWANLTMRQIVNNAGLTIPTGGATRVRVTFEAHSTLATIIPAAFIGIKAASGDAYDYAATPVQLTFNGSTASQTIAAGQTLVSDWVNLAIAATDGLVVGIDMGAVTNPQRQLATKSQWQSYYKATSGDAATVNATGYSVDAGVTAVRQIEVSSTPEFAEPAHLHAQADVLGLVTDLTSRDISVRVTNSAVQALTSNAAFTWNTLDHEIGSSALWDAGQPTRFVAPIAGTYIITACIAAETDSVAAITIRKNGVTSVHNSNCPRFWSGSGSITAIVRLAANDYVEALWGGGSVNSIVEASRHYFAMVLV